MSLEKLPRKQTL